MTNKTKKPMPVWAMIITDVVLTAAAIGVFMLFDYVMPQSSGVKGEVIAYHRNFHPNGMYHDKDMPFFPMFRPPDSPSGESAATTEYGCSDWQS